jgi:hypothetical protein
VQDGILSGIDYHNVMGGVPHFVYRVSLASQYLRFTGQVVIIYGPPFNGLRITS